MTVICHKMLSVLLHCNPQSPFFFRARNIFSGFRLRVAVWSPSWIINQSCLHEFEQRQSVKPPPPPLSYCVFVLNKLPKPLHWVVKIACFSISFTLWNMAEASSLSLKATICFHLIYFNSIWLISSLLNLCTCAQLETEVSDRHFLNNKLRNLSLLYVYPPPSSRLHRLQRALCQIHVDFSTYPLDFVLTSASAMGKLWVTVTADIKVFTRLLTSSKSTRDKNSSKENKAVCNGTGHGQSHRICRFN